MYLIQSLLLLIFTSIVLLNSRVRASRSNIVIFIADDLGWDDVGFHGSRLATPNADLLAYSGVALGRYYTHCVCTPSRAALLTGKFAYTLGMHGYPLTNGEDRGLPVTEKILPQYLKELGYATHLVGKWHVGRSRTEYLPTSRGFDTYFGHKGGGIDYYEYTAEERWTTGEVSGLDLTRNTTPSWDMEGYITDIYTDEAKTIIEAHDKSKPLFLMVAHSAPHCGSNGATLQAPPEVVRNFRYLESPARRIYAAMVKKLDDSLGEVMKGLADKGMLDDTIVVFIADNGGMTSGLSANFANNFPLRGLKFSPFEGGIRVAGAIWAAKIAPTRHLWDGYIHVVDWLPTILGAIDADIPSDLDGINQWNNMFSNSSSKREEFFEIDDYIGFNMIVSGNYKLVKGVVKEEYSNYQGADLRGLIGDAPLYEDTLKNSKMYSVLEQIGKPFNMEDVSIRRFMTVKCKETPVSKVFNCNNNTLCLFDIKEDPCETKDISSDKPDVVATLLRKLQEELKRVVARPAVYRDPRARPSLFNFTWSPWADELPYPQ